MGRPICKIEGCKNLAEKYSGIQPEHYRSFCNNHRRQLNGRLTGWQRVALRKQSMIEGMGTKCQNCALEGPKGFLDIHHKDGNHRNNTLENLALLCPNCHRMEHLKKIAFLKTLP